ncbi:DNA-binding response regulator [Paenibacillus agaridevorans]|uniref:DNA-binding response regulator n=1 Tax=Paenibacillus agaridevorans TaxID=171404 RepID=A0A2R5EU83_9BACL|nr:response regulator [Paenibacillus agaridevorans]GBG10246.1 DNA-binding response regulator [Paenibacillus agaridevorans]
MISVLIVDDDKLVRKGLASSMPWETFGMEIAGEANNGENALKFMESHPIDLLITDLSMPVMSGIELMRIVREKYPEVQIVVLSLHQDFEYVQEALRLGAIDYIAKIQLEQEQFEEVLGRIVRLMERKDGSSPGAGGEQRKKSALGGDELYVYYSLSANPEEAQRPVGLPDVIEEAEPGIWYSAAPPVAALTGGGSMAIPEVQSSAAAGRANEGKEESGGASPLTVACVRFTGLSGLDPKSVLGLIRSYGKHDLFYDYRPGIAFAELDAVWCQARESAGAAPIDKIKERWAAADWISDDARFREQLDELKELRMPPVRLIRIFYSLTDEWNRLYQALLAQPIEIEDFFPSWSLFGDWLAEARDQIKRGGTKPLFSQEIQSSIMKAMSLAQQNVSEPISSAEIAAMVNMSGSYFSQCFKQYVGRTYTDYVRDIRMDRAKDYLRSTNKTIGWVAEQIGYHDEKYFSRLFREHVGVLPSEFRQQH